MLPLLQLLLPEIAAHHRVAVLVDAVGEVLAGDADHIAFPALQFAFVQETPLLHDSSKAVRLYCFRSRGIGNGFSPKKGEAMQPLRGHLMHGENVGLVANAAAMTGESRPLGLFPKTFSMSKYPIRTTIGAVVVLVFAQTYCSFMTPWIVLLFAAWVLGGSKLT